MKISARHKFRRRRTNVEREPFCFAYARVATVKQSRHGESLDEQQDSLKKYYENYLSKEYKWADIYIDPAISAGRPLDVRPAASALLSRVQTGDMILSTRMDRMFRSIPDAAKWVSRWDKQKINCYFMRERLGLDGTASTRMVFHILAAVAEFQRELTSERTAEARQFQAMQGIIPNSTQCTFGVRRLEDGHAEIVPEEIVYMRICYDLSKQMTVKEAAVWLHQHSVEHPRQKNSLVAASTVQLCAQRFLSYIELRQALDSQEIATDSVPPYLTEIAMSEPVTEVLKCQNGH